MEKPNPDLPECRICFSSDQMSDMISNICQCKGYSSSVHKSCLLEWIQIKAIRHCEVCKAALPLQEVTSFTKFFKLLFERFLSTRKRVAKFSIYSIYLYLFFKRLTSIFK